MNAHDVDGLNDGYARALLDEYLENPEAVPSEWRALFESGDSQLVASHPGIARLLEKLPAAEANGGNGGPDGSSFHCGPNNTGASGSTSPSNAGRDAQDCIGGTPGGGGGYGRIKTLDR